MHTLYQCVVYVAVSHVVFDSCLFERLVLRLLDFARFVYFLFPSGQMTDVSPQDFREACLALDELLYSRPGPLSRSGSTGREETSAGRCL